MHVETCSASSLVSLSVKTRVWKLYLVYLITASSLAFAVNIHVIELNEKREKKVEL